MQNIGGVACRRSEVANVTVAAIERYRALQSSGNVRLAGGLTNPQIVPGSQVSGVSPGAVPQWPLLYNNSQANLY